VRAVSRASRLEPLSVTCHLPPSRSADRRCELVADGRSPWRVSPGWKRDSEITGRRRPRPRAVPSPGLASPLSRIDSKSVMPKRCNASEAAFAMRAISRLVATSFADPITETGRPRDGHPRGGRGADRFRFPRVAGQVSLSRTGRRSEPPGRKSWWLASRRELPRRED